MIIHRRLLALLRIKISFTHTASKVGRVVKRQFPVSHFPIVLLSLIAALMPSMCRGQLVWSDNFDSYTAATSLSGPWSLSGCDSAIIDSSTSVSAPNSVRIYGAVGGCCGTHAWRTYGTNRDLEVDFYAKCGGETLSGCHPEFVTVQLWDGVAAESDARTLIHFHNNGNIYGGGGGGAYNQLGDLILGTYETNVWYYCRVQYILQNGTNVVNNFWINNVFCGTTNYQAFSYEGNLTNISFASNEGTTWYDNVSLTFLPSQPSVALNEAIVPSFSDLLVGTEYQLQVSSNLSAWTNQGAVFTATNSTSIYPQYFIVSNWNQLYFRLQEVP